MAARMKSLDGTIQKTTHNRINLLVSKSTVQRWVKGRLTAGLKLSSSFLVNSSKRRLHGRVDFHKYSWAVHWERSKLPLHPQERNSTPDFTIKTAKHSELCYYVGCDTGLRDSSEPQIPSASSRQAENKRSCCQGESQTWRIKRISRVCDKAENRCLGFVVNVASSRGRILDSLFEMHEEKQWFSKVKYNRM